MKSKTTLDKQVDKVNEELTRLELTRVKSNEERALVDAAFDAEGTSIINASTPHLLAVTAIVASLLIANASILQTWWTLVILLVGFVAAWGIMLLVFTPRQVAVAITNIVNYRANSPQPCDHQEPRASASTA